MGEGEGGLLMVGNGQMGGMGGKVVEGRERRVEGDECGVCGHGGSGVCF